MPALPDISFDCDHCDGPLMAEVAHEGLSAECPHCYRGILVPSGRAVNKETFIEPSGLRRILLEIRNREWESMRRRLRNAEQRTAQLEAELASIRFSADVGLSEYAA